jgi:hypothetical protein
MGRSHEYALQLELQRKEQEARDMKKALEALTEQQRADAARSRAQAAAQAASSSPNAGDSPPRGPNHFTNGPGGAI